MTRRALAPSQRAREGRNWKSYPALNNLFFGSAPQAQLSDWRHDDFRLEAGAPALNAGVAIPGCTDEYALTGAPDPGVYPSGGFNWRPGAND